MATNTLSSNFSGDIALYIAQKILSVALKQLVVYQLADKATLPKNSGLTFQYTRYERVALPQSPLAEGVTPSDTQMSISTVQAVVSQWGAVIPISDVAIDSVKHPVLQKAIQLAGMQAQETLDREIINVLLTNSSVYFPNGKTSRGSLTSSEVISSTIVSNAVSNLRAQGAMPYDEDMYVGVLDSFSEVDMVSDQTFTDAAKYGMIKKLLVNEVGTWKGVRWVRSNTLPKMAQLSGCSAAAGAGAAGSGSLSVSTTYNFKVAVADAKTKQETFISPTLSATTNASGAGSTTVDLTIPALPAGATAGSTYNVYAGSNGGTMYQVASGVAASSTSSVGSLPVSGIVAQATPPASGNVHFAWVLGKEAFTVVELNKITAYLTPATPTDSDPLVQRRKVGWKCQFKSVINNDQFLTRIEHMTNFG